jgi:hypothetical protein
MNCNDQIVACLGNSCACVKYDPVTGQLAIDGQLVKLYMQATSVATAESLQGKVLNPAIEVGAAAITGLCAAIGPCMAALPPGSIDVSALKPGAEGTVLQTLSGVPTWAGLDDSAIQKAFGDNPVPQPPIDSSELAKVYGEDGSQNLTSVKPEGVYEAGAANMPLIAANNPLKQITGLNAGGMAVKANIIKNGAVTLGEGPGGIFVVATGASQIIATAIAPADGLYAVSINAVANRKTVTAVSITSGGAHADLSSAYLVIGAVAGLVYHSGADNAIVCLPNTTYPAGAAVGEAVRYGQVMTLWLVAGETLDLHIFNTSRGTGSLSFDVGAKPHVKLTALGPMAIAP